MSQDSFPFSLSRRGAQAVLVTPLNSTETQFLSEIHLEGSVWREMRSKLSAELGIWECPAELLSSRILWPQGQSIEDFIAEADRVLGNTDNCGEFVPENLI